MRARGLDGWGNVSALPLSYAPVIGTAGLEPATSRSDFEVASACASGTMLGFPP